MMTYSLINRVPLTALLGGIFLIMAVTWVAGRWIGVRDREQCDDDSRTHASGLLGAMLGLLALLLGFTFSMAVQRFEFNRDMVAHEASAIEAAYLRADVAAEPERLALKALIRRYVDTRVAFYDAEIDMRRRGAIEEESQKLQDDIWSHAITTAVRTPNSVTALLVEAVNELNDAHTMRLQGIRNMVPSTIMWLLILMAAAATGLTGYVAGFGNRRHPAPTAVVLLLIASVIVVIADLDRPMRGMIKGGQESMIDLQRSLRPPVTAGR